MARRPASRPAAIGREGRQAGNDRGLRRARDSPRQQGFGKQKEAFQDKKVQSQGIKHKTAGRKGGNFTM